MYTLLNANHSQANPNPLTAPDVKGIYINLFNSREVIIDLIPDEKRAALRREMEASLVPNQNQGSKGGKIRACHVTGEHLDGDERVCGDS